MKKGFTLVELMVTMLVISIISTIAVVSYSALLKNEKDKINTHTIKKIEEAALIYCTKNNCNSVTIGVLVNSKLLHKSNLINQINKKQICNTATVSVDNSTFRAEFNQINTSCTW